MNWFIATSGLIALVVTALGGDLHAQTPPPSASPTPPQDARASEPLATAAAAPTTAPAPPPPCSEGDDEGDQVPSSSCAGMFGIRASVTRLSSGASGKQVGLMLWGEGEDYTHRGMWSARGMHKLGIGGGGAGFEGTLMGGWAGGVRLPVGASHGPVLRAGLLGAIRGNDMFYDSLLELPQLQLGYQYLRGKTVLELGATTGAVLVGRHRTGEMVRRIVGAGFEVGGYAALQLPWLRLGAAATQLPTNDELSTPVRVAEGNLCALLSPIAICADARATIADAVVSPGAAPSEVRSMYAGLSVGMLERAMPHPPSKPGHD
jgi:hypothetical protein